MNDLIITCQNICSKYGFEDIDATWEQYEEFKIKWERSTRWIRLHVSDYLLDAPSGVLEDTIETLMERMAGQDADYPNYTKGYFMSDDIVNKHQAKYIERHKKNYRVRGRAKDLNASVRRLIDKELIEQSSNVKMFWSVKNTHKVSVVSPIFRVIAINRELDVPDVSDDVLDFLVYDAYTKMQLGSAPTKEETAKRNENVLKYPGYSEMIAEMTYHGVYL